MSAGGLAGGTGPCLKLKAAKPTWQIHEPFFYPETSAAALAPWSGGTTASCFAAVPFLPSMDSLAALLFIPTSSLCLHV